MGDLVFLPQPNGRVVVRRVPSGPPTRSPLQVASSARLKRVAAAWQALGAGDVEAWERYARGLGRGTYQCFQGLGAKLLQVRPEGPVPTRPPETAFLGDGIVVRVGGAAEGGIAFSTDAPNAPGVVTELLLQRLAGAHRKPVADKYRTRRFVAFAPGTLAAEVACKPGAYACAIRFVREATGQETAVVPLGKVTVGG